FLHGQALVPRGETRPVEAGLNQEVLRTRRPLRVADYAAARRARHLPPDPRIPEDSRTAWIGVPMLVGERLIGLIALNRPPPFTADDSRLLEAIAALCAVAIENADLVQLVSETAQDLMRRTKELSDLNNVASAVNRSLDLPTVLAAGADMLLRATGWDLATVYLREPEGPWHVALHRYAGAAHGAPPPPWRRDAEGSIDVPDSPLRPFVTQALATGRPVELDLAATPAASRAVLDRYLASGLHRLVVFPLLGGPATAGRARPVLGLLLLGSRTPASGKVTAAEMLRDTTLLAIGEQLATAVQNARLLDAVQTARSHLAAVLESTTDGVIFYNLDLRVELANRAVHEQYGLPPGTFVGHSLEEVTQLGAGAFADPAQPYDLLERLRAAPPDAVYADECVMQSPHWRVFQRTVHPVADVTGTILGRLVVYHDITQAKDLERRTRELAGINAVATALNRSLDLTTMLDQAARAVLDVTGWDTVAMRLWNPLTRTWDLVVQHGPERAPSWPAAAEPEVYGPITPGLLAGRPCAFQVSSGEMRIAFPIHVRTQTLGMLELGCFQPIRATEVGARMADATLRGICEQLALAIENSRLYAEARQVAALEERQHLARELHDSVTQSLFTVTLMAEAAQAMVERDPRKVAPYLQRLQTTAGAALNEMRSLLAQLRPTTVGASGLGAALRRHAETVGQQLGLAIEVEVDPELGSLPTPVEDALYRIAQEALHNVIKHAGAQQAWVRLVRTAPATPTHSAALVLTVEDDGRGFDAGRRAGAGPGHGLGLTTMRERAVALGGHMTVASTPGHGSRILVAVPLHGDAARDE
ncbi:MAG TPA: GAF domain-containing protein, partial [Chloroflexia bacterium]|nr:GAF domain-containing protein [Chloroflexia bacterium]